MAQQFAVLAQHEFQVFAADQVPTAVGAGRDHIHCHEAVHIHIHLSA
jgi:hypothetical protein